MARHDSHRILHNRQAGGARSTVVRTIFKTMTPDGFDGNAGGWSTLAVDNSPTSSNKPVVVKTTSTKAIPAGSSSSTHHRAAQKTSDSLPPSIAPSSQSLAPTLAIATGKQSTSSPTRALTASSTPTQTAASDDSSASIGGAAKAGIAIGVLGGVLFVFLAMYFLFSRRRRQAENQRLQDDEKINGPFADSAAPPPTPAKAPRLSLRPVTQFLATAPAHPERRTSRGPEFAMGAGSAQQSHQAAAGSPSSPWERPMTSSSANSANPFGSGAKRLDSPTSAKPTSPSSAAHDSQHVATAAAAGVAVGMAAAGLARKTSMRKQNAPAPLDLTAPSSASLESPAMTAYSANSLSPGQSPGPSAGAAAIAAAGGPAHSAVHRVQLDFNPTLEDEMELKAGQLVRVLHEYDDGWALCIRLDRSQQGVVPRTCLSTRPVKPRPPQGGPRHGPPVNPNQRQGYPPSSRPTTPQSARPAGPPQPRPDSPARAMAGPAMSPGPRTQSPALQQMQGRPQSPNQTNRRISPPGPSAMNPEQKSGPQARPVGRKPVPGQAY